jgi:hypothetical protein
MKAIAHPQALRTRRVFYGWPVDCARKRPNWAQPRARKYTFEFCRTPAAAFDLPGKAGYDSHPRRM